MNRALVLLLLAVMTGFGCVALAQPRYGVSVDVAVVEVPVTVTDRAGNPVRGLSKDDFKLYSDGKRIAVQYFDVVDLVQVREAGAQAQPLPAAAYRNFVLLFDLANSSPASMVRARDAARQFVEGELADLDLAAIATYRANEGVRFLTNFTRDRSMLVAGIRSIGSDATFAVVDPLLLKTIHDASRTQPGWFDTISQQGDGAADRGGLATMKADIEAAAAASREETNRSIAAGTEKEQIHRIQDQLASLSRLALALDRLQGQKQVILLSEGFAGHLLTGREKLGFEGTQKENDAVASGELWKVDTEKRFGGLSTGADIVSMADLFRRANVLLHAIDIRGLRTNADLTGTAAGSTEGLRAVSSEGLSLVARPTGGTVFRNSNDLAENFRRMLRQQEVIYILGFKSSTLAPGEFHRLRIETTARNAQVTHRGGYFEASPFANDMERLLGVGEILSKDIVHTDVPVALLAAPVPSNDVLVSVEIDGASVLEDLSGERTAVDVFVYAFDEKREVRDFLQQRIVLDLTKTRSAVMGGGIRYVGALHLEPGRYSINALARVAGSGRMGSAHSVLTVASAEPAAWTAVAMAEPGDGITVISPARGNQVPFVPRVKTTVRAGTEQRFALPLSGALAEAATVTGVLKMPGGDQRPVPVAVVDRGEHAIVVAYRADGLAAGPYELAFTVGTEPGPAQTATVTFVVP